jgi:hypothetical protein
LPCLFYLSSLIYGHVTTGGDGGVTNNIVQHGKLANDFGKFAASALIFLLFPISKLGDDGLFSSLGLGGMHVYRIHVHAGYVSLFGSFVHGAYHVVIWTYNLDGRGDTTWDTVFPFGDEGVACWTELLSSSSRRRLHDDGVLGRR